MKMDITEQDLMGYLLELIHEYANHAIKYTGATVDECSNGEWVFSLRFKFMRDS